MNYGKKIRELTEEEINMVSGGETYIVNYGNGMCKQCTAYGQLFMGCTNLQPCDGF